MAGSDSLLKRPTFASSDHGLAKFVARPVLRFIDREVAGGSFATCRDSCGADMGKFSLG